MFTLEAFNDYQKAKGAQTGIEQYEAMLKFMDNFDCLDATTPAEAYERVIASMDMLCAEMDTARTDSESSAIMHKRLSKF